MRHEVRSRRIVGASAANGVGFHTRLSVVVPRTSRNTGSQSGQGRRTRSIAQSRPQLSMKGLRYADYAHQPNPSETVVRRGAHLEVLGTQASYRSEILSAAEIWVTETWVFCPHRSNSSNRTIRSWFSRSAASHYKSTLRLSTVRGHQSTAAQGHGRPSSRQGVAGSLRRCGWPRRRGCVAAA